MTSRRRSNRDHACLVRFHGRETRPERIRKKQHQPGVADEVIEAQLEALLTPALFKQSLYYRQLGLRNRLLNLPLMMAAVLTLLWRNVAGVRELTRMSRARRMLMVSTNSGQPTGDGTTVLDLSGGVI